MTAFPIDHPILGEAAAVLRDSEFVVAERLLDGMDGPVLVVESPYLVAVLLAADRWTAVSEDVGRVQVALANWASKADRSSRRWDLYVVVLLESRPTDADEGAAIEMAEASTDLARKIVRSGVSTEPIDLRNALRPLLPLAPTGREALPSLTGALRDRLRVHGVDASVADKAVEDFISTGKVWL